MRKTGNALSDLIDRLFAIAIRLAHDHADAEDLVQDTLLRGLQAMPRLNQSENILAYLHKVMTNLYINHYRHRRVVQRANDLASIGILDGTLYSQDCQRVWADPQTRFDHTNFSSAVAAALDELPPRFREVLVMADLMDQSYAEIAQALDIPVGTVMSRLFRARRWMRARLSGSEAARCLDAAATAK